MSNMSNSVPYLFLAVRTVAAGHRMIADGWAMFEEVVEAAGTGDLPQLFRLLRGWWCPHHHQQFPCHHNQDHLKEFLWKLQECLGSHQWRKKRGCLQSQLLLLGGLRKWACPHCSTVRGLNNGCNTHQADPHRKGSSLWPVWVFNWFNWK